MGLNKPRLTEASWSGRLDDVIEPMLHAARIPGAAIAIASSEGTVFARGYGYTALDGSEPMATHTLYPIASTTKALNATLLGMLVDAGQLAWDEVVQTYLPHFELQDRSAAGQVTVRDLVAMRTGLPRHDWVWFGNPISRAELLERLRYLQPSAGFRERFQYNNLTVTIAGHVAEAVTGESWEDLVRAHILRPLRMQSTGFARPSIGRPSTRACHENSRRQLTPARYLAAEVTAPSGGALHSTVEDMARWLAFNLNGGLVDGRALIGAQTLTEMHSPQVAVGNDPSAPTPNAAYALGWFVDTYNGRLRLSHGGLLHDVNSHVLLFPQDDVAIVAFTNFAGPRLSRLLAEHAFDVVMGFDPVHSLADCLAEYERKVAANSARIASIDRGVEAVRSLPLHEYVGIYCDAAYGEILIDRSDEDFLILRRGELVLPLEHWSQDEWIAADNDLVEVHKPHVFDRSSPMTFETHTDGGIAALTIAFEPSVDPIRFNRR